MRGALPPGPALSATHQSLQWMTEPWRLLEEAADLYGTPFTLELNHYGKHVVFSRPEAIREIFTTPGEILSAAGGNAVLRPLLGDNGLLLLEGRKHRRHRSLVLPALHGRRITGFADRMQRLTLDEMRDWRPGAEVALHEPLQRIALGVILEVLFGSSGDSPERHELADGARRLLNQGARSLALLDALGANLGEVWTEHRRRFARLQEIVGGFVDARSAIDPGDDVTGMLVAARDEDGKPLSRHELVDELLTLVVTGFETAATALAWCFRDILSNPTVLDAILDEIDTLTAPGEAARLPWVSAAIQETLRLHSVIPIVARKALRSVAIGGWTLPAGVTVAACIHLAHRDPHTWPDPDRYDPVRFLDRTPSPYVYLPFGGGDRRCVGASFARLEMAVVLTTVLSNWEIALVDPAPPDRKRRTVTIAPADGTRVRLVRQQREAA